MNEQPLKPASQRVTFGEVVQLSKARSSDPLADGYDRYVGLEHIEPEDLHIGRWGNVADGVTFTSVFKPGQVLFGKRRAYQRKVAVADFSGVCSGDIYVLESKDPKVLLPALLPAICQTESFFRHAVGTSAGSLSPRTNWTSLAEFEFVIPSLDKQHRITEVITAAMTSENEYKLARDSAWRVFVSAMRTLLSPDETWTEVALADVATVERGRFSHRPRNLPQFFGESYPFVQTGDIVESTGILRKASQMLSDEGVQYSKSFPKDSILMTIAANIGFTAITTTETWCPDSVVGIVPNNSIDVHFLEYILRTKQNYLENNVATQTAQKNINLQDLKPLKISIPKLPIQKEVSRKLIDIERAWQALNTRFTEARNLRLRIVNAGIGGVNV